MARLFIAGINADAIVKKKRGGGGVMVRKQGKTIQSGIMTVLKKH